MATLSNKMTKQLSPIVDAIVDVIVDRKVNNTQMLINCFCLMLNLL